MSLTTLSIYRSAASELFIQFKSREEAYNWGVLFIQYWGNDPHFSPFEGVDSSKWGSPVAEDSYFELFIFDGKELYNRSVDWYKKRDLGFSCVNKEDAFILGRIFEP